MNILVLTTAYQTDLEKAIKDAGHTAEFCNPNEFNMYISESTKGMDSVYKGEQRIFRTTYDCVISRVGNHRGYAARLIEHLQNNLGIFCLQSGESLNLVADKFRTAQILSQNGIRVPKQVFAMSPKNYKHVIDKVGGLPAILKENTGSQGNGLILLESPQQTNMTLDSFYGSGEKHIIIQRFLNNGGKDERHIVVNGEVVSSMERQAPKHDIRSNISREGTGKKINADSETRELCIKAVAAIEGLNFAGVDVMKDTDGKPYVIEINSNPGTGIIGITGYNHFKDLVRYCERNYRNGSKVAIQEKAQKMIYELCVLATNVDADLEQMFRDLTK
jgi:ribosomal protein S6--L-glutamate ligase